MIVQSILEIVQRGVSYTMFFIAPHTKKSIGDKSVERGGKETGPQRPMGGRKRRHAGTAFAGEYSTAEEPF